MTSPDTPAPAVSVSRVGYVEFRTPDVDRMLSYYTEVLDFVEVDRSAESIYLATGPDHHCVVITAADHPLARASVGYEIDRPVQDAARRMRQAGYQVQERTDPAPGTASALVMTEPTTGVELQLFHRQEVSGVDGSSPLRPTKLGHVAAFTPALDRLQAFYQDLLGFRWSDTIGDFFVFLRCNADHHAANFLANPTAQGMHHVAYEMRDPNHLITMLDHLAKNGYRLQWGPGRHGPGHNIFTYHRDPDGNTVELFTQLDQMLDETRGYWEPRPWHETYPQGPRTWEVDAATTNIWGPLNESIRARAGS